jgi:hypothetical protein
MQELLSAFQDELEKISRATLTWAQRQDPLGVARMQPGMYEFGGTPRVMASDRPGFYKPPVPLKPQGS